MEKEFIEKVYEIAFGDNAINKGYPPEEVIKKLREFSDTALRVEDSTENVVEVGGLKFMENLRWLLCVWEVKNHGVGWPKSNKSTLGKLAFGLESPEAASRRIRRLCSGHTELKVKDLELIAGALEIHPAILLYGTKNQLIDFWNDRCEKKKISLVK